MFLLFSGAGEEFRLQTQAGSHHHIFRHESDENIFDKLSLKLLSV